MSFFKLDQKAAEEARKARNKYAREWRAANREKVRRYNETYWAKKALNNAKTAS